MPRRIPLAAAAALAATAATAVAAAPATADSGVVVDSATWTARADDRTQRDCRTRGTRGTATRAYRVPVAGVLQARLRAPRGSDWDLAVVDAVSGRAIAASLGFGGREVVAIPAGGDQRVVVRACRRSGPARRATLELRHATLPRTAPSERWSLVEVRVNGPADQERIHALGLDTADHSDGRTLKVVLHGAGEARTLVEAGFSFRTLVADLLASDRADRLAERRTERLGVRSPLPSGRTTYRTLADHQADMKKLATDHPDLVRGFVLPGTSLEGREISGVEVAAGVGRTDDGRPHVYVDGVNHAREWPAGEIPTEFAIDLVKNPKNDPRLSEILNGARTFVVPIVNVDGFDVSRTAGEPGFFETVQFGDLPWAANGAGAAYKRKNCRFADQTPPAGTPCLVAHLFNDMGVDTNRNYGFGWGGPGASATWAQMTYRGAGPFSEPETTALRKFMFGLQPAVVVSNHTVAALMLRPPGQQQTPDTPDEAPMKALGDAMAAETGYLSQRSWELYDTTGTTLDWTYGALGAWSYTPELGGDGFHADHPESVVEQYEGSGERGGMRAALILAAQTAIEPRSHAIISGRAPAGRTLRITRTVPTKTWNGDALDPDTHTSTLTVPESGRYEWHVTPSRRPYEPAAAWTLTCERDGQVVERRDIPVERGERVTADLDCGAPAPSASDGPAAKPSGCPGGLRALRARGTRRGLAVVYRAPRGGRVTVEVLRGKRRVQRVRGSRRRANVRLRNGRYVVRVTLAQAGTRRDVQTIRVTKRGNRVRIGKPVRGVC